MRDFTREIRQWYHTPVPRVLRSVRLSIAVCTEYGELKPLLSPHYSMGGRGVTFPASCLLQLRSPVQHSVFRVEAESTYMAKMSVERTCALCNAGSEVAPKGRLWKCSACKLARYCSQACQVADWRAHKAYCRMDAQPHGVKSE